MIKKYEKIYYISSASTSVKYFRQSLNMGFDKLHFSNKFFEKLYLFKVFRF